LGVPPYRHLLGVLLGIGAAAHVARHAVDAPLGRPRLFLQKAETFTGKRGCLPAKMMKHGDFTSQNGDFTSKKCDFTIT
jgi:hypothetical protein